MRQRIFLSFISIFFILTGIAASADQDQPQTLAELGKVSTKFSFIVLGDNRAGDPACDAVYQKLLSLAVLRQPAFIVNTGDLIDKPGNPGHWSRFRELSKIVTMPYFLTVGNHDIHPEVAGSEQTYKDQVDLPGNELYYSFTAGNSLFVVLDSSLKGEEKKIIKEQLAWLDDVLAASTHKHKFVFVHVPLFSEQGKGKHSGNNLDRYPEERDRLHALFVKYDVTMVFSGHEHIYSRKTIYGIPYIITGGGGAPLYTGDLNSGFYHFIHMTIDGNKVSGEVVDVNGKVRDTF